MTNETTSEKNILLREWELPPFGQYSEADYAPAIATAIAEAEAAVEAIATNPEPPTFQNTIEVLESCDRRLQRITAILFNLNECCTSDQLQQIVEEVQPDITRFSTRVSTDERLFSRVEVVYSDSENSALLTDEQRTLLENTRRSFLRHGVALPETEREHFSYNEEELAQLQLHFGRNALADQNEWMLHLTDEADLEGLPQGVRDAARAEAKRQDLEGWVFTLAAPVYQPFMAYCRNRKLREQMYRAYGSIGGRGNEHDNNRVIGRIVQLRAEQATLLGYHSYCDYILEERMVRSLSNLKSFLEGLRSAVLPAAQRDLSEVQRLAQQDMPDEELMPWDFSYYAEQLKTQRYAFDSETLRPYFPLEAVREGIFGLYGRLYGLRFEEDSTVPVYHPEVQVYRVWDTSRELGILYLDMFSRPSKRSGAWMTEFRGQYGAVRPQIQVVCNFSRPVGSQPALLRFSEVETFMHEMGHAMHGMLSDVQYESLSGTNVKRDFVEMPSQVMENWCYEPDFLATFARHWETGEALPMEMVEKIRQSQNYLAGWLCLRQINLGMTDVAFHQMALSEVPQPEQVHAEAIELAASTQLLPHVDGCCTATNFNHLFAGGYASGYYGYKWAEVLDADIFSRFRQEGIFNADTANGFRRTILSQGGTRHPAILFRNFMGRDPDDKALLKRMNLL